MRESIFGLCVAILVLGGSAADTAEQDKSARGTVTAIKGDSLTIKSGERELTFTFDSKTVLTASGAGTASRKAEASGKPGPRLSDFVKTGDTVEVSYQESAGTMRATNIRRTGSGGGGTAANEDRTEIVDGTVLSIEKGVLTVSGAAGGGSTFKQSFMVDANTRLIAVGAGTAAAKGSVSLTDFVGVGDQVTVSYRKMGTALHADEVRLRAKKK